MASKVNEVICRQFGQSRAALPKGGWADGRTGADGQSLIPAAAPRRSTSLHEGIIEDRISKRVQSAKEAAGVGTIHIQRKESQKFVNPEAPRSFEISTRNLCEVVSLGQT